MFGPHKIKLGEVPHILKPWAQCIVYNDNINGLIGRSIMHFKFVKTYSSTLVITHGIKVHYFKKNVVFEHSLTLW